MQKVISFATIGRLPIPSHFIYARCHSSQTQRYPGAKLLLGDKAMALQQEPKAKPSATSASEKTEEPASLKALLPSGFFDNAQTGCNYYYIFFPDGSLPTNWTF